MLGSGGESVSESRFSRYRIDSLLGEGAIGKVYLATDLELERPVALKIIQLSGARAANRDEVRTRFEREAKLTARLQHPNIVVIYEFGEGDGALFLAMEYVPGGTLAQRLAATHVPFPVVERIILAAEIAEAIAHAHERGVLHRDLKPANILLTASGDAKVSDFGIGRLLSGDVDLTDTGELIGSPAYMSPEQMRGERLDAKSDIFGLGVVLFHLLTGRKPFDSTNLPILVTQIQNEPPPDPCAIDPALPLEIRGILLRCLEKGKDARYPDAGSLANDLRALLSTVPGAGTGLGAQSLRKMMGDTSGSKKRPPEPLPQSPPAPAVATHVTAERASEVLPTIQTGSRHGVPARAVVPFVAAAAACVLLALGLAFWLRRTALETAAAKAARAAIAAPMPTPEPTREPTQVPAPAPTADAGGSFLSEAHPSWPTSAGTSLRVESRSGLALHVLPGAARVFLDGRYVGVADDWDGQGGSVLAFPYAFRHNVRVVHPGFGDLEIDLVIRKSAAEDVAIVREKLPTGSSSAPTGLVDEPQRPEARTSGELRLDVTPRDTKVAVDGVEAGSAASFSKKGLVLDGPAVHVITLTAEGKEPVRLRVLVSPAVKAPHPSLRRKL